MQAPVTDQPAAPVETVPSDVPSVGPVQEPAPMAPVDATQVDFVSGWDEAWSTLTAGAPGLSATLGTVGLILVCFSLVKWAWNVKKGQKHGDALKPVFSYLLIGSIMAAPSVIVPLLLTVVQTLLRIVLGFIGALSL